MALTKQEKSFVNSIQNKIDKYHIRTTLNDAMEYSESQLVYTTYNTDVTELVDAGIELFLIKKSFSYFLNEYARVDIPGLGTIAMNPYYFQTEVAKELMDYRKIVLDKTRQSGLSTIFALYSLWRAHFFPAESIDVVSVKQKKAQQFVKKIYSTMNSLPEWMRAPIKYQNQQEITFIHGSSTSTILSESQSDNAGRGDSLSVVILDEVAFYQSERMARNIIASAQPTLNKTGGQLILISTPNGVAGKGAYYYEQVVKAKAGSKDTKYLEIDWWEVPDDPRINGPKKGYNDILDKAIKEGYYYKNEIKKKYNEFFKPIAREYYLDNKWLKAAHDDLDMAAYRQEILHDFIVAGAKVFSEEILANVEARLKDPVKKDVLGTSEYEGWWVWKQPIPGHRYILGGDISTGTGNDFSTLEVIDVGEYEQVAEYKGHMSTPNFSRFVKKVANLYNEGFVVIECNSIGEAVFNGLYYSEIDPYNNVYKQKKTKNGITRMTGWITDVKTRKLLTNDFIDWITVPELFDSIKIYSKRLWMELSTWIWSGGNKPDHSEGCVSGDTIITCESGFKQIKDIKKGEKVLTHTGNFQEVSKIFKFKSENKKMLEVKSWGCESLNITSNQELYINDGTFKNFDNIYNYKQIKTNSIYSNKITKTKEYDPLYLFFIGHVLADGTISQKNRITITSENKESVLIFDEYLKYFKEKVKSCSISEYPKEQFRRFNIGDKALWEEIKEIGISTEKNIYEELRYINPKDQLYILYGYLFGDGSFNSKRTGKITSNSISYKLSYFISSILYRNKISFNLNKQKVSRYNKKCNDQWSISILGKECLKIFNFNQDFEKVFSLKNNYENTFKFIKNKEQKRTNKLRNYNEELLQSNVSSVEQQGWDDFYYDITVEEDHSYIANGYIVHNSHDDTIIAFALAMYNRNKAVMSGNSFLITDDGDVIGSDSKDKIDDTIEKKVDQFDILTSEATSEDSFQENYGCSQEQYSWLMGETD